ncbi:thioredoxin domain-containing protein [Colwellia sp. Bg11-12]|jgi:protein-disulfide isomerase|uniref:DsbA family protein n=1 Tax=Colwellia sp. Bg11-12 TaxID=2759817 RepID=UPI0015F73CD7|nr:thioredoxin domain-containing protein [Colwellia sp. Bg11-12]MBA6264426.1 thioredoxin domain-containing protein [Colwellia sp. Bg11-12]
MNKKSLFISASLIILLAFIVVVSVFKANNSHQNTKVANLDVVERIGAPIKGPLEAKVTIVEFFDPACETCSAFSPLVNNLIKKYPGKVNVMMRYTPFHKGSDQVVKLLEAAHLQGQFWPAVDILFSQQQRWTRHHVAQPQSARALLKDLPLDNEQFMRDVSSDKVSKVIMQDIEDGKTLDVRATPQFFVNGKPLTNFGYEQLTQLVEEAIANAY